MTGVKNFSRPVGLVAEGPGHGHNEAKAAANPYTYTKWDAGSAQWKGGAGPDAPGGNG